MYIYECWPIDYFSGMYKLSDYIKLCRDHNELTDLYEYHHNAKDLKKFLIECFINLKSSTAGWEGDIAEIAISGIPKVENYSMLLTLVLKQKNNGTSFIVSEFPYPLEGDCLFRCGIECDLTSKQLLQYFTESYDLVEHLFNMALVPDKKEKNEPIPIIHEHKKDDKFDESNFEKL